jgi:putative tricarboxylic transport membrane protein
MIILSNVTGTSALKSILGIFLGIMLSTIGIDVLTGVTRFTFGSFHLSKGIELVAILMGMFGITEVLTTLVEPYDVKNLIKFKFRDLYPTRRELARSIMPILRGSLLGLPIGLLPCPNGLIASLLSYKLEKSISKQPDMFGKGAIEGVAGPESANNSAATTGMIPLFSLGLPFTAITAVLLGAFMVHGVVPGPMFITSNSDLFWGLIASFYIGNLFLLILNYPFVGVFALIARISPTVIMPLIVGIVLVGVYTVDYSFFDLWITLAMGVMAFVMKAVDFNITSVIIGFVLGGVLEKSFRQAMVLSDGSIVTLLQRPIVAFFVGVSMLLIVLRVSSFFVPSNRKKRIDQRGKRGGVNVQ